MMNFIILGIGIGFSLGIMVGSICMTIHNLKDCREEYTRGKRDAFEDVYDQRYAGMCAFCEHDSEDCHKHCGEENWERETFFKWIKGKM